MAAVHADIPAVEDTAVIAADRLAVLLAPVVSAVAEVWAVADTVHTS